MTKGKVVPFPFDDLSGSKVRPAVCLTNAVGPHRHIVVAFITSQIPDRLLETDLVINASDEDFDVTGLQISSTVRLHRLMTATTSLPKRELGVLSPTVQVQVDMRLRKLFGLG
jgi:mRNA interferase MazF